ncbi:2-hydroxyacid dehydrogenase, partial [Mesorhizobium sp. M1D.F.Ca.ET.184.01.1.1]
VGIERADPALVTEEMRRAVRGVASFAGISAAMMDALPNLELIASFGVGYDSVDVGHAAAKNIMVTNTPDVLTEEVADTAIGLLINTVRDLPRAETWLRDGNW